MYSSMSMCICEYRALSVSMSLGPVSYMRTEAPYLLSYSEPLCFSGPTPAQLRLRFGTPTGPKYCATHPFREPGTCFLDLRSILTLTSDL